MPPRYQNSQRLTTDCASALYCQPESAGPESAGRTHSSIIAVIVVSLVGTHLQHYEIGCFPMSTWVLHRTGHIPGTGPYRELFLFFVSYFSADNDDPVATEYQFPNISRNTVETVRCASQDKRIYGHFRHGRQWSHKLFTDIIVRFTIGAPQKQNLVGLVLAVNYFGCLDVGCCAALTFFLTIKVSFHLIKVNISKTAKKRLS